MCIVDDIFLRKETRYFKFNDIFHIITTVQSTKYMYVLG